MVYPSTRKRLAAGLLGLSLSAGQAGCYKATFIAEPNVVRGQEHDEWTSFFVFGLIGHANVDVHEFCPSGEVAEVATGGNFGTGIVTALTLTIYSPRKVYVTCSGGTVRDAGRGRDSLRFAFENGGTTARVERRDGDRLAVGTARRVDVNGAEAWRVDFNPAVTP